MDNSELISHIKGNIVIAIIGGVVNMLYSILPIRKIKSWEHFWLSSLSRFVTLVLSVGCGLLLSLAAKSIGLAQYSEAISALGALGGADLVKSIKKRFDVVIETYKS